MSRVAFAIASVGLLGAVLAPTARADQWDKRTILTVNEPIQVPGQVMPPGKYVMKLLDSPANRHIVQIFNEGDRHLVATVLAIPNYRLEPTSKTQFSFWETPAGHPKALRAWFYPGDNFGQEFAYSKTEAASIAAVTNSAVPTTAAQQPSEMTTTQVGTVKENGEAKAVTEPAPQEQVAQNTPAPAPVPEPQAEPETPAAPRESQADGAPTAPVAAPDTLPHTATTLPGIGLVGLISLCGFVSLRLARG